MFRPAALAAGTAIVLCSLAGAAQQAPSAQTPVFRSSVDLVHLDVSVLDSNRVPVRGLTAKDFTVLEDGKPQPIAAFSAVDVPDAEPLEAPWLKTHSPDVQTNTGTQNPEGRLFVVLMDDAMMPPYPAALESARQIAKKFVDRITPADRVAVVFSASGHGQDFTNDRAKLTAAIDSLQQGYATHLLGWETAKEPSTPIGLLTPLEVKGPKGDPDLPFRAASIETLRQVADTLISAPQRRKALILVSPGVEIDEASATMPVAANIEMKTSTVDSNRTLSQQMPELVRRMQRANVTIYPVDPCGAGGLQAYVLNAALATSALRVGDNSEPQLGLGRVALDPSLLPNSTPAPPGYNWLNTGMTVPRPDQLAQHMSSLSLDFLTTTAASTGGVAIINTNDFDTGLDRIFRENSSYYVIGYQIPAGSPPGSIHRLSVKVNHPGVEVRTRNGYSTPGKEKPAKGGNADPLSPLDAAIAGAVPNSAFPMRVVLAPFVVPGKKNPVVTIVLGLEQPAVEKRTAYGVELQTNAYTPDGKPRLIGRRDIATVVLAPSGKNSRAQYDLLSTISLPPGRYQLRLSAHRALDNVDGSLYADVEIPDFAKAPLSVSGLMLETIPAGAAAPADAFDMFVPVVPTSNRAFRPNQDATAFMRIYQGGKDPLAAVTVHATLVDRNEKTVGDGTESVAPDRFHVGGRAADYKFPIPLAKLPPGPYLLTFEIAAGKNTVTRSLQFTVEK